MLSVKHLLGIKELTVNDIEQIFKTADNFKQVLQRQIYVSKEISEKLLWRFSGQPQKSQTPTDILTDREFEILQLVGSGKSPKEIAQQLHISGKTVAVHSANVRHKLKLQSTAQMIRFAVQSENLKALAST